MRLLAKFSVLYLFALQASCSFTETGKIESDDDLSWVAEARKDFEISQEETERQIALLRAQAKGANSYANNEKWALYRANEQVYGVRTKAGKVTGELMAEDAEIVGRWVRVYGDIRTSGDGFRMQREISEDYADIQ